MLPMDAAPDLVSAASACAEGGGQWKGALRLFRDMLAANVSPTLETIASAMTACVNSGGQWEQALWLLRGARHPAPAALAISACAMGGQELQASKILEHLTDMRPSPDVGTFNVMMRGCAKGGQ